MNVIYHKFSKEIPIVLLENGESFKNIKFKNGEYFKKISFNKSPLKFMVFELSSISKEFGKEKTTGIIDSTLAYNSGINKFPLNEKQALTYAIKLTILENRESAFNILKTIYNKTFNKECPYNFYE